MPALNRKFDDDRGRRTPFFGTAAAVGIGIVLLAVVCVAGYVAVHGNRRIGANGYSRGNPALGTTVNQRKPSPGIPFPSRSSAAASTAVAAAPAALLPSAAPAAETSEHLGPARTPGVYFAKHQKIFGRGCDGRLALTAAGLDFACSKGAEPPLHFTVGEIKGANSNGIQLKSGEKYHFDLGTTKEEEQQIFSAWASAHVPGYAKAAAE